MTEPYVRTTEEEVLVADLQNYASVTSAEVPGLARRIVDHIGSPDPELRDDLGFTRLVEWIVEQDLLEPELLIEFAKMCIGERGLRFRVGESATDSVFCRSFSALVLSLVLHKDLQREFLPESDWLEIVAALGDYCRQETDFRGFVTGRGWAHSIAHAADAIDEALQSRHLTKLAAEELCDALASMVDRTTAVLVNEEEDRVAQAMSRSLAVVESAFVVDRIREVDHPAGSATRTNWKHIVRSLYFRIPEPKRTLFCDLQADLGPM